MTAFEMWRLLPRQIACVDANRGPSAFTVRYRWDGDFRLIGSRKASRGRYILVLDPRLPFRRRFRPMGKQVRDRRVLKELVAQLFPFDRETTHYALGEWAGESYAYAMPEDELRQVSGLFERAPQAVLVATPDATSLRRTIALWLGWGRAYDLLAGPRFLPLSAVLSAALLAATAGLAGLAADDLLQAHRQRHQESLARVQALRSEAGPLDQRRQVLTHMNAAYEAVHRLTASAGPRVQQSLNTLLGKAPLGVEIRSIVFDGTTLRVSGWDSNRLEWLEATGLATNVLAHDKLPERDYFEIEVSP